MNKKLILIASIPLFFLTQNAKSNVIDLNNSRLIEQCGNGIPKDIFLAVTGVESQYNQYAIGVVRGWVKQPRTMNEAVQTAKKLHAEGKNFSMGIAQVNKYNLAAYGLNYETVFDPCKNVSAGTKILLDCFNRAKKVSGTINEAWEKSFSCYYSGNFKTGFKRDFPNQLPYVSKVVNRLVSIQGRNAINSSNVNSKKIDINSNVIVKNIEYNNNESLQNNSIEDNVSNVNYSYLEAKRIANIQEKIKKENQDENNKSWEAFSNSSKSNSVVF